MTTQILFMVVGAGLTIVTSVITGLVLHVLRQVSDKIDRMDEKLDLLSRDFAAEQVRVETLRRDIDDLKTRVA